MVTIARPYAESDEDEPLALLDAILGPGYAGGITPPPSLSSGLYGYMVDRLGTLADPTGALSVEEVVAREAERADLEEWEVWLREVIPQKFSNQATGLPMPFAEYHRWFWRRVWEITLGIRPRPIVAIWARSYGKSTGTEGACVVMACRGTRRYVVYVSDTQSQADDHVDAVAQILESQEIARRYPSLGVRLETKYGHSRGWRRSRLRTAGGFTLDALGLDKASRGRKLGDERPDAFVLDDLDSEADTLAATEKKIRTLTRKILPMGTDDAAVFAVQNLVIRDGIFGRLAAISEHEADFLQDRDVSGPHPAFLNLEYHQTMRHGRRVFMLTSGESTWDARTLEDGQQFVDSVSLSAFLIEYQHQDLDTSGGHFDHIDWSHVDLEEVPPLSKIVVALDPAVSDTDKSDSQGVQVDGIAAPTEEQMRLPADHPGRYRLDNAPIYRLFSWERQTSPREALTLALTKALEYGQRYGIPTEVLVETDQGGDLWLQDYDTVWREMRRTPPPAHERHPDSTQVYAADLEPEWGLPVGMLYRPAFVAEKAGSLNQSKLQRVLKQVGDYERGLMIHVRGTHLTLEKALRRFGAREPYDLADCSSWSRLRLRGGSDAKPVIAVGSVRGAPLSTGQRRQPGEPPPTASRTTVIGRQPKRKAAAPIPPKLPPAATTVDEDGAPVIPKPRLRGRIW